MTRFDMAILITFWILIALTLIQPGSWRRFWKKSPSDWVLDLCGLTIQGMVIPALQIGLLYQTLHQLIPSAANSLSLPPVLYR